MTTAQILFSIALGVIGVIILFFAVYVLNTTMWANRWVRAPKRRSAESADEESASDSKEPV